LLRECLKSVYGSRLDFEFEVCVVDNASSDGSADMVAVEFPQARLIRSGANGGFAAGNNLGLRSFGFGEKQQPSTFNLQPSDSKSLISSLQLPITNYQLPTYVLLLNPDTVLPPNALAEMLAYMERRPEVGAAGPKLILEDGSLDLACRRSFPTPEVSFYRIIGLSRHFPQSPRFGRYNLTYLNPDVETEVDSVMGAFMLVRACAIEQAGLLDEKFFMYGEDLDWAYRIKAAGWRIFYYPAVAVQHVKRAASRQNPRTTRAFYEAMLLFNDKHYRATTPLPLYLLVVAGIRLRWWLAEIQLRTRPPGSADGGMV
jgi:GT2 family glycosyltransferase